MGSPVYVAGAGVISAIGNNIAETLESFEQGKAGMGTMQWLHSIHREKLPVAEVKLDNPALAKLSGLPPAVSRTALLSAVAAQEALSDAGIEDFHRWRTGFVSANTVGGMDKTEDFFVDFLANPAKGRLRNLVRHECGSITEIVADRLGIRHYVSTLSTACSSSANAIFHAARLIKNNILDIVVAGGTDALTKFTLNGFNTLMILDADYCRPFDENRKGLNLGEGAGYLVLVSARVAAGLGRRLYARLSGYANANDAYHQTASSPEGTGSYLAMKAALEESGLQPADISYINLHGTGTQNNDISEGTAIKLLFEPRFPKMSSTKSFTGHTLGASGGLEAVFSVLSIQKNIIYPNLRLQTPMKELPFVPVTTFINDEPVNHVLSNSFGFGGNCSSLVFSKIDT
ncbi:MAG TPA: beta-ketoacyl-[acyl-carrier-protein] synthase family protein [Puia sp.]|nr:beta-ketoacyl-[acyl-carrier-protein] synthase family protein [Puia sp.]